MACTYDEFHVEIGRTLQKDMKLLGVVVWGFCFYSGPPLCPKTTTPKGLHKGVSLPENKFEFLLIIVPNRRCR